MISKILRNFLVLILMPVLSGCIRAEIKGAGVFKEPVKYEDFKWYHRAWIDVPPGVRGKVPEGLTFNPGDGSKIDFRYIGNCGAQLSFTGIMIPFIPFWLPNFCESDGLYISEKWGLDILGVTLQLHYNGITYDPYIDNGSVKFKIENFSTFKSAPDKSLIIHKRKPDGTMWTQELPFDWKIVTEVSGGL